MSRFRGAWTSLNFYKEYLFGFETLVFATLGIFSMHEQLVTLQRERKLEIASYDPFNGKAKEHLTLSVVKSLYSTACFLGNVTLWQFQQQVAANSISISLMCIW